jgi:hypothetical protein
MKEAFSPYLTQIMPSILSQANLKVEMGVAGMGEGELGDVMKEI